MYGDFSSWPVDWDGRGKADSLEFLALIADAPYISQIVLKALKWLFGSCNAEAQQPLQSLGKI